MKTTSLITDEQALVSASSRFGTSIPIYDDGYGPLFIHRDSMGVTGIVRARTWEDAYSIVEDEFLPSADETHAEFIAEYGEDYTEDAAWQESYGFRSNSRTEPDGTQSSVYAKDLNGDSLDLLTPSLLADLGITLEIETPVEPEPEIHWFAWHESRRCNPAGRIVATSAGRYGSGAQYASILRRSASRMRTRQTHSHYSPNCDFYAIDWQS